MSLERNWKVEHLCLLQRSPTRNWVWAYVSWIPVVSLAGHIWGQRAAGGADSAWHSLAFTWLDVTALVMWRSTCKFLPTPVWLSSASVFISQLELIPISSLVCVYWEDISLTLLYLPAFSPSKYIPSQHSYKLLFFSLLSPLNSLLFFPPFLIFLIRLLIDPSLQVSCSLALILSLCLSLSSTKGRKASPEWPGASSLQFCEPHVLSIVWPCFPLWIFKTDYLSFQCSCPCEM